MSTPASKVQLQLLRDSEMLLKCGVCWQRITPPVVVCRKGHCICKKCNSTGVVCPICNKFLITDRFFLLEKLLSTLPKRCKYFINGCRQIVPGDSQHDEYCLVRPKKCELGKDNRCTWTGRFGDWLKHARDVSHVKVTSWNATDNLLFAQYYRFQARWETYNMLLQFRSCYFLLYSFKSEEFLHITMRYLGQNADFSMQIPNYCVKITFLKDSIKSFTVELDAGDNKLAMCEDVPLDRLDPLVNIYEELDMYVELQM